MPKNVLVDVQHECDKDQLGDATAPQILDAQKNPVFLNEYLGPI